MKKKLVAIAIAAAFAPAAAMAEVTVYGKLNADFESVKNDKATATKTSLNRVTSNTTYLGFKGKEDLGDGLAAIFQIETQVNLTNNTAAGGAPFNVLRNSNVGLSGNFGTVFMGNWDSPFKAALGKIEGGMLKFANSTFASSYALLGTNGNGISGFNGRMKQSVHYNSPNMSGFKANFAYGTDNQATNTTNKNVWSASGVYDQGPFYAALGHQKFNDVTAGNKDSGTRLVGAYNYGAGSVGLDIERLGQQVAGTTLDRNAWSLAANYITGANHIAGFYTRAGDRTGTANSGARQITLRYGYNFSKRTELYGMYTNISNDTNGAYNFIAGDGTSVAGTAGSKLSGIGVGIAHAF